MDRVRANMVWDKDTRKWVPKPSDKNTVLQNIMGVKRPKSAFGLPILEMGELELEIEQQFLEKEVDFEVYVADPLSLG